MVRLTVTLVAATALMLMVCLTMTMVPFVQQTNAEAKRYVENEVLQMHTETRREIKTLLSDTMNIVKTLLAPVESGTLVEFPQNMEILLSHMWGIISNNLYVQTVSLITNEGHLFELQTPSNRYFNGPLLVRMKEADCIREYYWSISHPEQLNESEVPPDCITQVNTSITAKVLLFTSGVTVVPRQVAADGSSTIAFGAKFENKNTKVTDEKRRVGAVSIVYTGQSFFDIVRNAQLRQTKHFDIALLDMNEPFNPIVLGIASDAAMFTVWRMKDMQNTEHIRQLWDAWPEFRSVQPNVAETKMLHMETGETDFVAAARDIYIMTGKTRVWWRVIVATEEEQFAPPVMKTFKSALIVVIVIAFVQLCAQSGFIYKVLHPLTVLERQMLHTARLEEGDDNTEDVEEPQDKSWFLEVRNMQDSFEVLKAQISEARPFVPQSVTTRDEDDNETNGASNELSAPDSTPDENSHLRPRAMLDPCLRPQLNTLVAPVKRRVTVIVFNLRDFHVHMRRSVNECCAIASKQLDIISKHVKLQRGVIDYHQGDHVIASFNAVKRITAGTRNRFGETRGGATTVFGTMDTRMSALPEGALPGTSLEGFDMINDYTILHELGRGAQGRVMLAIDEMDNYHAIKVLNRGVRIGSFGSVGARDPILREIAIMKKCQHPHIVKLEEVVQDDDSCYIVMQYIERGPVIMFDCKYECTPLPPQQLRKYVSQIALGLEYLHSHGVIHHDVKPDNILIGADDNAYLTDFGVSEVIRSVEDDAAGGVRMGTLPFLAPEIIAAASGSEARKYGREADVWALGVTMYVLAFGKLPFGPSSPIQLSKMIREDPVSFPPDADTMFIEILQRLLQKNPAERMTLKKLRLHPYMAPAFESDMLFSPRSPSSIAFSPTSPATPSSFSLSSPLTPQLSDNEIARAVDRRQINYRRVSLNVNDTEVTRFASSNLCAAAAAHAAINEMEQISVCGPRLQGQAGISCGEALAGNMGTQTMKRFYIIGPVVPQAMFLERHAKAIPGSRILVPQWIVGELSWYFLCKPMDLVTLPGTNRMTTISTVVSLLNPTGLPGFPENASLQRQFQTINDAYVCAAQGNISAAKKLLESEARVMQSTGDSRTSSDDDAADSVARLRVLMKEIEEGSTGSAPVRRQIPSTSSEESR